MLEVLEVLEVLDPYNNEENGIVLQRTLWFPFKCNFQSWQFLLIYLPLSTSTLSPPYECRQAKSSANFCRKYTCLCTSIYYAVYHLIVIHSDESVRGLSYLPLNHNYISKNVNKCINFTSERLISVLTIFFFFHFTYIPSF